MAFEAKIGYECVGRCVVEGQLVQELQAVCDADTGMLCELFPYPTGCGFTYIGMMTMSSFFLTVVRSSSSSSGEYSPISRNRSAATSRMPSASLVAWRSSSGDVDTEGPFGLMCMSFSILAGSTSRYHTASRQIKPKRKRVYVREKDAIDGRC